MDLFSICTVLLIPIILFWFASHFSSFKTKSTDPLLPPGKTGLPFFGETLHFLYNCRKGNVEDFYITRMNNHSSKAFKTHIFGEPTVVLCGPNGNKFLFSNENKLLKAWWPSTVHRIFEPDSKANLADELKILKKIPHILKPESLKVQVSAIDAVARRHFSSKWEGKDRVSVHPLTTEFAFAVACRIFLSVDDPERVRRLAEPFDSLAAGLASIPVDFPGTQFRRALKAAKILRGEIASIARRRRSDITKGGKSPATEDVMSHMMAAADEEGGALFANDSDVAKRILGYIFASRDTTSIACSFIVKYLAEFPKVYERVYKEQMDIAGSKGADELLNWDDVQKMKYSWNVACEVMRLKPPALGSFREAIVDFEFEGFLIPKGYKLHWTVFTTNLNPEYFTEPMKFDPSRFDGSGPEPYTFVPFSGGPRMCGGREHARVEILVFMHNLVKRFKWDKIIPDEKTVCKPMMVPEKGLPIRLYPHNRD